ncbi:MAG: GNAT family N-acetyltransferase [Tuberibacillus sp.]
MPGWTETPWDTRAFEFETYEIKELNEETLKAVDKIAGHFTARIDPLASKKLLHDYHFYYCDTLIEPYCDSPALKPVFNEHIEVSSQLDLELAKKMCKGTFKFDRFHRDFHIPNELADRRYAYWIEDIAKRGSVLGFTYKGVWAGFFACEDNKILLHALTAEFQGKGLAKYFWSAACQKLFDKGYDEISSSISAANMAVLNLYRSIGFSFRNPMDIYHKFNPPKF